MQIDFSDVLQVASSAVFIWTAIKAKPILEQIECFAQYLEKEKWLNLHRAYRSRTDSEALSDGAPSVSKSSEDRPSCKKEDQALPHPEPQHHPDFLQKIHASQISACQRASSAKRTKQPNRMRVSVRPASQGSRGHRQRLRTPKENPHKLVPCAQTPPACRQCACSSIRTQGKRKL